jgi:hypothetical protein
MRIEVGDSPKHLTGSVARGLLRKAERRLAPHPPAWVRQRERHQNVRYIARDARPFAPYAPEGVDGHSANARHRISRCFDHCLETRLVRKMVQQRKAVEPHARVRMLDCQHKVRRHDPPRPAESLELTMWQPGVPGYKLGAPIQAENELLEIGPSPEAVRDGDLALSDLEPQRPRIRPLKITSLLA